MSGSVRGGFNGRPLMQWPTRPLGGWAWEAGPQTPLGELTALLQTPSWIRGAYFQGRGGKRGRDERGGEGEKWRAREGRGKGRKVRGWEGTGREGRGGGEGRPFW